MQFIAATGMRGVACRLLLVLLAGVAQAQVVVLDPPGDEFTVAEDSAAIVNYAFLIASPPTDDLEFTLSYDASRFLLGALIGADDVGDPNTFMYPASRFVADPLNPGLPDLSNPNNYITFVLAPIDNAADEGDQVVAPIVHTVHSTDPAYDGSELTVTMTFLDDDAPLIEIVETDGSTQLSEADPLTTDSYRINFLQQPTDPVTVTFEYDDHQILLVDAEGEIVSNGGRIVQPEDFAAGLTLTVFTLDDNVDEPDSAYTILHRFTSPDPDFNLPLGHPVVVSLTDNDVAHVIVEPILIAAREGGDPSFYTIRLGTEPTEPVTVAVSPQDQVQIEPRILTFDASNWVLAQTVTVTAVDDDLVEASTHSGLIEHNVTSDDPHYDEIAIDAVNVNVIDNDLPGLVFDPPFLEVREGDDSVTYTVTLDTAPSFNVAVRLDADDQIVIDQNALLFTPDNATVPQKITVTALEDLKDEDDGMVATIEHTVSGGNLVNDEPIPLNVTVNDNDTAGITIDTTVIKLTEGGEPTFYNVLLDTEPDAPVTVEITSSDSEITFTPMSITFTPDDWFIFRIVEVHAVDDIVVDGSTQSVLTHMAHSTDKRYDGKQAERAIVDVTDNNIAKLTVVTIDSIILNEVGPTIDGYRLVLETLPTETLEVTVDPDEQLRVRAGAGEFLPPGEPLIVSLSADVTEVTIDVMATQDGLKEAPTHRGLITHQVTSAPADPEFINLLISNVVATISDPPADDRDGDGLSDEEEAAGFAMSVYIPVDASDPSAGVERHVLRFTTDPNDPDSDDDGIRDLDEVVTYARFAAGDGSVPGVPELGASPARQFIVGSEAAQAAASGFPIYGPVSDDPNSGVAIVLPAGFVPKPVWGVRSLASNHFADDAQTRNTLLLLQAAGLTISGADTDGDGVFDPDDPAPHLNPQFFLDSADVDQTQLLNFDWDGDGFPENVGELSAVSEQQIESATGIDYSNDGTLDDGFDFLATILAEDGGQSLRLAFDPNQPGLVGDGVIQAASIPVDPCPTAFNPDDDGDGRPDEVACQDAPAAGVGCFGLPLGVTLLLPLMWALTARGGSGKRRVRR